MNAFSDYLYDIELPPEALPAYLWIILGVALLIVLCLTGLHCYRQHLPIARALKSLRTLPEAQCTPYRIAALLRDGLQLRSLGHANLPPDFMQQLDSARYDRASCSVPHCLALQHQAQTLLQQRFSLLDTRATLQLLLAELRHHWPALVKLSKRLTTKLTRHPQTHLERVLFTKLKSLLTHMPGRKPHD